MKRWAFAILVCSLAGCGPGPRHGAGDDDGDGGNCAQTCSSDNTSIVDCNGNVVMTCGAGDSCANGACLDACDAAAQNKSSIGCDYYAVNPDSVEPGQCFAAYIANTSSAPLSITVDLGGMSLPTDGFARVPSGTGQSITYAPLTNGMLQPNQVAILFLANDPSLENTLTNCPTGITPAFTSANAAVTGTNYGDAFHITTSQPAVLYDIYPYGGGASAVTSATLLLPTTVWDVNYVAADAYTGDAGSPFVDVVGMTDSTMVTITPTTAISGNGSNVPAGGAGMPAQYMLNAGQELQFEQPEELIGSVITSSAPVGVWGGATCMDVTSAVGACDTAHQEIPPVKSMGNHYAAVRYRNRFPNTAEETVPWRIVGAVDGTTLTYSPSTPPGAPTTLMQGQMVEFESPGQFVVESQGSANPFYMAQYMSGCETVDPGAEDCRGDPEYVNIVPPEQYLSQYTFFTDPTYPETNLVLMREKVNGAFADVNLDCVGTVTGWMPIDSADDMEYTRVDIATGNFQGVGSCNNGLHVATSSQRFGLVVWGWGTAATGGAFGEAPSPGNFYTQCVSYGYPAGASVKQINQVVIE